MTQPDNAALRPPTPIDPEHKKIAEDWYTWGFQAGIDGARSADGIREALEDFVGMFSAGSIPGSIGDEVLQKAKVALAALKDKS